MPRDPGLEHILNEFLAETPGITTKPLFGGFGYLLRGNLLFGARTGSLLVRLGKGNDAWALATPGITPMAVGPRAMPGYIRANAAAIADDAIRTRLLEAAIAYVSTLPAKPLNSGKRPPKRT